MHPDPDDLERVARGEADDVTERRLQPELDRVFELGRIGPLETPPAHLWSRIAEAAGAQPDVEPEPRPRAARDARGPRRWWPVAAAAAAVLAAVLVLVVPRVLPGGGEVLGRADLQALPGWSAEGSAEVVQDGDRLELRISLGEDAEAGFREVWLISAELDRLVSLGVLTDDSGTFAIPAGLDVAQYPVVDVSDEPYDGDPAHSGESIARGTLDL